MQRPLQELVDRGQPAHAAEAARLLARLAADPDDAQALGDAADLVDAYLHDPYLTRYPS
jgi:mannose/cellobiose epimerase-like protein (N-acyl-D-glucosamine 2-epimerase family)